MNDIKILEQNEEFVVCIKPQGVTSEDGSKSGLPTLLAENDKKPLVVHRLDREVSGVMVLAKNKRMAALISKQITDHTFQKEYLAVVEGKLEDHGILEDLIYHDRVKNKTYIVKKERNGVKSAKLEFWRLGVAETPDGVVSLARVKLFTGRTHQIRVQFASRKHPLMGDRKYGSRLNCSFALFSRLIELCYFTGKKKVFTAKLQNIYPWSEFEKEVSEV